MVSQALTKALHWLNVWSRLQECEDDRRKMADIIAEIRLDQAEMREELETWRQLHEIGTVTIDMTGRIIKCGPNFATMSGYTIDELIGMPVRELVASRWLDQHDRKAGEIYRGERLPSSKRLEGDMRCKDGHEEGVYIVLAPMSTGTTTTIRGDVQRRISALVGYRKREA